MADVLSVDIAASFTWLFSDTLDLSTISDASSLEYDGATSDGTGSDQADKLWHDQRVVAAASNDDLDLTSLTLPVFGGNVSISFAKVKAILLVNTETTSGRLVRVGGAGTAGNAFAAPFNGNADAVVEVGPDSPLLLSHKKDGWSVTAGTGDILRIANPDVSAAATYRIAVVGTSV